MAKTGLIDQTNVDSLWANAERVERILEVYINVGYIEQLDAQWLFNTSCYARSFSCGSSNPEASIDKRVRASFNIYYRGKVGKLTPEMRDPVFRVIALKQFLSYLLYVRVMAPTKMAIEDYNADWIIWLEQIAKKYDIHLNTTAYL